MSRSKIVSGVQQGLRLAGLFAGMALAGAASAIEVGEAAPALSLPKRDGAAVALPDGRARLTYVDFWASWCGPCRQSFPWLNAMQARYGAKGLRVVGVNLDTKLADAERFLGEVPAQFEIVLDPQGASARRYALKGMPSAALLAADGRVIAVHRGFRGNDGEALEALIKTHLNTP
ncbi:TlpA family protein disulfide reductase [Aquabacterium sp.]|uniref:TlpA family protein disulfide reductase n=1 Tax=Aquabacterium sp. TaxID=1872578 RepID=UPI002C059CB6|nr:TlpA disulfide reductase family protein [Aquabacterium sp.]HSW04329.1 TlpA disulfide reductase family protein [Aquabacterium sp.]